MSNSKQSTSSSSIPNKYSVSDDKTESKYDDYIAPSLTGIDQDIIDENEVEQIIELHDDGNAPHDSDDDDHDDTHAKYHHHNHAKKLQVILPCVSINLDHLFSGF